MAYVIAIDVGIKNLGLCVFDMLTAKVIKWDNVSLVPGGRYTPALNVQYVLHFISEHKDVFENASAVIVERQMRCNMRIIEAVFQTLYYDRCKVINPRCVKAHYKISMRNYRANKVAAVEWTKEFVRNNPNAFTNGSLQSFNCRKQDDLADALLLCLYYLDTYSTQLE